MKLSTVLLSPLALVATATPVSVLGMRTDQSPWDGQAYAQQKPDKQELA